MTDRATALRLAEEYVGRIPYKSEHDPSDILIVVDESTIEFEYGFVFFYTSKRYLETRDFKFALAGNAPIIAAKQDGKISETGTAYAIEHYIEEFLKRMKRTP
jgi:Immunity protein 35